MLDPDGGRKLSGEVVVYGATGFTGRLTAHAAERAGLPLVLAGRNRAALEQLAAELGDEHPIAVARHDDPDGLAALTRGAAVLVSTAGPFMDVGGLAVAAAVSEGSHYLDSTGEIDFMAQTHRRHDADARDRGIAVINSCAFEYAVGDCAVEIALAEAPDASEVRVTYYVPDKAVTRGTAQTMVRILSSDAARATSSRAEQVVFPGPVGKQWAVSHAGGEEEFLHRRRPGLKVTDLMNMPALVARSSAAMPIVASVLGLAPVRRLLDAGVQRFPVGPDAERRAAQAFVILVEIDPGRGKQRGVVVNGVDPYGLTAEILARSAARLASGKGRRVGVVSPAEAFDPVETLDSLAELGLSWKRLE